MANLKEILPMILAGLGGAASPQGADVFNNILRQKRIGEEQSARQSDRESRLSLAQLASDRADRSEARAVTNQEGSISLRQMKVDQINAENERLEIAKESKQKSVNFMISEHPDLVEAGVIDNTMLLPDIEKVIGSQNPEAPTFAEHVQIMQDLKKADLTGSVKTASGVTIGTGPKATAKAEEAPLSERNIALGIIQDNQAAISKAMRELDDAQTDVDVLAEAEGGDTLATPGAKRKADARLREARAAVEIANGELERQFRDEGFTEEGMDKYLNPQKPEGEPEMVSTHGPMTPRELFFAQNPHLRDAPGF